MHRSDSIYILTWQELGYMNNKVMTTLAYKRSANETALNIAPTKLGKIKH